MPIASDVARSSRGLYSSSSERQAESHLPMRIALLLASLAIAGCANLPVAQVQAVLAYECEGLPVTKESACDRAQLDDRDPDWHRMGNADIFEAMFTAYDRVGAEVLSGALTERQGEERMADVKAALGKAANKMGGARRQAIAHALTSSGIAAQ
jgi:hypothetical protein